MRLGGRMVAGYYPCPVKVVRWIGALLCQSEHGPGLKMNIVDPCAADGEAVVEFTAAIERVPVRNTGSNIFACELEAGRAAALERRLRRDRRPELGAAVHGDAFRVEWSARRSSFELEASALWLNCPYDSDKEFGRLEERWLRHFLPCLKLDGGVLVFVIPITALAASIDTIAKNFTGVVTYRFPDPYYAQFQQIVVIGKRRRPTYRPEQVTVQELNGYVDSPGSIPVLPTEKITPLFTVPTSDRLAAEVSRIRWERRPLDAGDVAAALKPWRHGAEGEKLLPGVLPENGVAGYTTESFTVAAPIKPGYVAPAMAVGVFDGVRLTPDNKDSGLPPVFCKATFVRDWVDQAGGEKVNAAGDVVSKLQVQQPRLIMTALDLRRGKYVKIKPSLSRESATDLDRMTALDFVEAYNASFLATLRRKCKPLFDPANDTAPEWRIARPLWKAQSHTAASALRCLETQGAALAEGETGTGKTSIGVAIASTMSCRRSFGRRRVGARRTLVVCPPHLLAEWLDEIEVLRPDARTMVVNDTADAEEFATGDFTQDVFGILAETTGKLAHGWAGVGDEGAQPVHVEPEPSTTVQTSLWTKRAANTVFTGHVSDATDQHRAVWLAKKKHERNCPACGEKIAAKKKDLATKRLRCDVTKVAPVDALGRLAQRLAQVLLPVFPFDETMIELASTRPIEAMLPRWQEKPAKREGDEQQPEDPTVARWARTKRGALAEFVRWMAERFVRDGAEREVVAVSLIALVGAVADDAVTAPIARRLYGAAGDDAAEYSHGWHLRKYAFTMLALLRDRETAAAILAEWRGTSSVEVTGSSQWKNAEMMLRVARGEPTPAYWAGWSDVKWREGLMLFGKPVGSKDLAKRAFDTLRKETQVEPVAPCGEALFAAVPRPRRVGLAEYLAKRWAHKIDLVIIDEIHENGSPDSAQTQAMEQFRGRPMLGLTGTISNGYAASMFAILHTFSKGFRMEFDRDDLSAFRERYGYQKRVLQDVDRETKRAVAFGTQSSRVIRQTRSAGDAAGQLPSFILRHFLPLATTLHLEDLAIEVPPSREFVEMIDPGPELGPRVRRFCEKLAEQIKADAFSPLAGKLFGQMSEAWSVADRASLGVGNGEDGLYRACYPESVGGEEVCRLPMMPPDVLLPKEVRLLEIVERELAEDRNVLIFAWHSNGTLFSRLASLLERHLGVQTPILDSTKVSARQRKGWLKENIVGKHRTMIVNPACVETGFNALTWFNTGLWFQPPGCAPKTARQTCGRIRRPGQTKEQRFYWLVYKNTLQVYLHQLLQLKIAESMAVDGNDNVAALRAAGVEPIGGVSGFDLGRAMYQQMARAA